MIGGALAAISTTLAAAEEPRGLKPKKWSDAKTECEALGLEKDPPWTIGATNYSLANSWRIHMMEELKFAAKKD